MGAIPDAHSSDVNGNGHAPEIMQRRYFAVATLRPLLDKEGNPTGKLDKAPRKPTKPATLAKSNDLDTLGTYSEALEAVKAGRAKVCGPIINRCGVMCLDLDNARDPETGEITEGAQLVISRFPGALITISVSGCGLHIWVKAEPPFSEAVKEIYPLGQKVEIMAHKFVAERWTEYAPGEIKPFTDEVKALYDEFREKPEARPAPAMPRNLNGAGGLTAYERATLEGKLDDARKKMEAALDGDKHALRLDLARLLGGFLHYGHFTEEHIEDTLGVNFGASEANARKAIRDGIEYGKDAPVYIDPPKNGHAPEVIFKGKQTEKSTVEPDTTETPRAPYEFFTLGQMARLPRFEWLVRGLLLEKIASVISGNSGSFKSFFVLAMALCIALGREFMGRETKRGNVVYVAAEGFFTLSERAQGWALYHGCELPENFHVLKVPVNLADENTVAIFSQAVRDFEPALIVLDTLSQNAAGADENSNAAMAQFVAGMMALGSNIGAHVTVLHHNAKSTGTFRGAGAIKDNVDAHISLEKPEGDTNNTVFVRCEKQRGKPFEPFALRGVSVVLPFTDEYGAPVDTLVFEPCGDEVTARAEKHANAQKADKTAAALLEVFDRAAIKAREKFGVEGVKVGFWKEEVEEANPPICSESAFWRHRKALEKSGAIEECGTHNGSPLFRRTVTTVTTVNDSTESKPHSRTVTTVTTPRLLVSGSTDSSGSERPEVERLPEMPRAQKRPAKRNSTADSEAYHAQPATAVLD